jgi:hypothetical protein
LKPPDGTSRKESHDKQANVTVLFGGLTGGTGNVNGTALNDTWHR